MRGLGPLTGTLNGARVILMHKYASHGFRVREMYAEAKLRTATKQLEMLTVKNGKFCAARLFSLRSVVDF